MTDTPAPRKPLNLHRLREMHAAGEKIAMLVLELIPAALAKEVTATSPIPVIGIGAGVDCSGQVLVLHDMLNLTHGKLPRFVRNFMDGSASIEDAVRRYVAAVKDQSFPDPALHGY
jgi:3-methyl-2-oxobutanoate hydroxymethyltransferase